ncbi:SusC/RagA family TonB-linked outer membrane protein [Desertivirga xinjiangensis]|uniref:SusC/RagA family TonB-linked outer membrane protein n=1 Tax=Desertivirga xinjiangensis TaxID=539206 RepID=UPI00210BC2AC|nr:TonB-dependent receptor [Pedobacter xinjiangensis]
MKLNYMIRAWLAVLILCMFRQVPSLAQDRIITGKVTAANNLESLPGVSISKKGTNQSTSTDAEGNYRISASDTDILVFTYIGFSVKEVPVSSAESNVLNISLDQQTSNLEEVVVVGYGTQRKSDVSGSIVSIKADALNAIPTISISEMLRGKASGVQITKESSRPGGTSNILIRGRRSLGAENGPLYVVDNVPVTNINDINAADIASLEILKDASSQAIYGARAANGVILITTKRGTSGKVTVDYNGYSGVQQLKKNFSLYNGAEWADLRREAFRTENNGVYESDESVFSSSGDIMLNALKNNTSIDWQKFMIRDAWSHKHDVSIRGGNEKTRLSASLGYFDQKGMVENSGFTRGTARINVDQTVSKKVSVGANLSYTRNKLNQEDGTLEEYLLTPPLAEPYDANGNLQLYVIGDNATTNPKFLNNQTLNETRSNRLLLNAFANFDLFKGFKYRINTAVNIRNHEGGTYRNKAYSKGSNSGNAASLSTGDYSDYLVENIFSYDKEFNSKNRFDATFMQSIFKESYKTTSLSGSQLPSDLLSYNGLPSAQVLGTPSRNITERSLLSYMGRLRYTLMDKYLFTLTSRIDGSTVFGDNNKYGIFPSASFAWKIEQEEFMKSLAWINQLKLRVNYGQVGNQAVAPYTTLGEVNAYPFLFGDTFLTGYLPDGNLSNPNLKWEATTSLTVGLDFDLFKGRISGALDLYDTDTKDLLIRKSINSSLGYTSMLDNLGKVNNKGLELMLNTIPLRTKDLSWGLDFTFSANKNKIVKISGDVDTEGNPVNDLINNWIIGEPISVYRDYIFDGIWQSSDDIQASHMPGAKPGDIRVKDINSDNKIDADDQQIIYRNPKWYGSLGTTLKYRAFDMALDFYTVQGSTRRNPYLYNFNSGGSLSGKTNGMKVNYWTPENPSNEFPRPRYSSQILYFSSLGYQNNSYIQFRRATIGYTLPASLLQKAGISRARAYVTGSNLFNKTDFASYSPEVEASGYPEPRMFLFGLNLSL